MLSRTSSAVGLCIEPGAGPGAALAVLSSAALARPELLLLQQRFSYDSVEAHGYIDFLTAPERGCNACRSMICAKPRQFGSVFYDYVQHNAIAMLGPPSVRLAGHLHQRVLPTKLISVGRATGDDTLCRCGSGWRGMLCRCGGWRRHFCQTARSGAAIEPMLLQSISTGAAYAQSAAADMMRPCAQVVRMPCVRWGGVGGARSVTKRGRFKTGIRSLGSGVQSPESGGVQNLESRVQHSAGSTVQSPAESRVWNTEYA